MPTRAATVDFLLDQLAPTPVSVRKMFGEYCLYHDGRPVGLVCDDQLFMKPTTAGRALLTRLEEGFPFPGARPHLLISADLWDDADWLRQLVRATAAELPLPKPRQPRKKATKPT